MLVNFSYPKEFDELWSRLKEVYPTELFNIEGVGEQLDINHFGKKFFTNKQATADVSIDSNANVSDKSVASYSPEVSKAYEKMDSYFMLWKYAKEIFGIDVANKMVESQLAGDIYINDFYGFSAGKPYCFNYSTYDIATKGLPMVEKIKSLPPRYLYAFKSQVEQFVTIASNSTLGATGLADLLLVMSFYVEDILENMGDSHFHFADEESAWAYVKENIVSMIYTINQPMRGNQSPFTNISIFDDVFLEKLSNDYIHPVKGTPLNIPVVKKIQEIFIDTMNSELQRTPITFPVVSACLSRDDDHPILDHEFLKFIAKKDEQFGFMNFYIGKTSTLSSCCRLRSDLESDYFNSFGAGSSKIGSLGVATVNYPRLGFKYFGSAEKCTPSQQKQFFANLRYLVELCFKINYVKLQIVTDRIKNGFHPLYQHGFIDVKKQYLTSGVNGLNELIELAMFDPLSNEGVKCGLDIIECVNEVNNALGKQYNVPVNVEQIPAENVSIKLADKDTLLGYNDGRYLLYSNQFIPLITQADLLDRMRLQGVYDEHFSGGAIWHLNVENRIDADTIAELIEMSAEKGIIYFAVNYNYQECEDGHIDVGRQEYCKCGKKIVDNYTRVVGFLTSTKHWHKVRREVDYPNRQWY
jgi:ribonucleoside-triphosphate reductase